MAYGLAFVDSIVASPTTRLDLNNDAPWRLQSQGTDFSPPPLRRAVVSTLLADGERIPAAAYGNRTIRLRLYCTDATEDGAATAVQNLARELDRPQNILRYQAGTTNPVFFRTFRADFDAIQWDPVAKFATVTIPAEPFAYGPVETLPSVTVFSNPAAASNGMYFDVSGVLGDVETPLILGLVPTMLASTTRRTSLFAVRRRGTPANVPFLRQAEALSLGTDTTLPGNDATMSGSGSNYAHVSFATSGASPADRLSGYLTDGGTAQGTDFRGTYRVFARARQNTSGDQMQLQLEWGASNANLIINDAVTWSTSVTSVVADLGLIQIPVGGDPVHDGYSGVEMPAVEAYIVLRATRLSGTGTLDIDYLLFVPADDRMLLVKWPSAMVDVNDRVVVDGTHEMVYASDPTTHNVATLQPPEIAGGFPMVSPNVTNRVFFLPTADTASNDTIGNGSSFTVYPSYYPRYLYVRPVST